MMNKHNLEIASYTEYAMDMVPMAPGFNTRVFNATELVKGSCIALDEGSGIISLAPGIYQISAFSLLSIMTSEQASERQLPGYCALRDITSGKLIATGTMMNAAYNTPSFIDTFIELTRPTKVSLEHQIGPEVDGVYLQIKAPGDSENQSTNHVFATITIRRL